MAPQVILASGSPRRADLLRQIGISFKVRVSGVAEHRQEGETPDAYVRRVALEKATAVVVDGLPVLGADTTVVLAGQILEKPRDSQDAFEMLSNLQGQRHTVLTAIAMCDAQRHDVALASAEVVFREAKESELRQYCASNEPMDKAGAYGIQGIGGVFIAGICGQPSTVAGLPLVETNKLLEDFGVDVWRHRIVDPPETADA